MARNGCEKIREFLVAANEKPELLFPGWISRPPEDDSGSTSTKILSPSVEIYNGIRDIKAKLEATQHTVSVNLNWSNDWNEDNKGLTCGVTKEGQVWMSEKRILNGSNAIVYGFTGFFDGENGILQNLTFHQYDCSKKVEIISTFADWVEQCRANKKIFNDRRKFMNRDNHHCYNLAAFYDPQVSDVSDGKPKIHIDVGYFKNPRWLKAWRTPSLLHSSRFTFPTKVSPAGISKTFQQRRDEACDTKGYYLGSLISNF